MVVAPDKWGRGVLLLTAIRVSPGLAKPWSLLKFSGRSAKFLFRSQKLRFCWLASVCFTLSLKVTPNNNNKMFDMKYLFPGQAKHLNSFLPLGPSQPLQKAQ